MYQEGGSLMTPPEMEMDSEMPEEEMPMEEMAADEMPVDTYPNADMEEVEASQEPDVEMEDNYMEYV